MAVPNIFGTATSAIPLSQLDTNFATPVTIGNTAVQLGNTVTSFGNVTLTNVTISSGNVTVSAGSNTSPSITTVGDTNTGIFFPAADTIAFSEGGAEIARFDSSGNFGLGVTPNAWSLIKGLQVTGGGFFGAYNNNSYMGANWYFDGTNKYIASDFATQYQQNDGEHIWYTAASGTAGNTITFTQAMTLNANGVLALQGASTSANGTGITFPATQSASSNANTLDDYEEGTWTPAQGAGLTVVGAYSSSGQYTKIGRSVTVFGLIAGATSVACTNNGQLCTGLPFTPNTEFQGALINAARSFSNNVAALGSGAVQNSTALTATASAAFTITYFV